MGIVDEVGLSRTSNGIIMVHWHIFWLRHLEDTGVDDSCDYRGNSSHGLELGVIAVDQHEFRRSASPKTPQDARLSAESVTPVRM